MRRSFVLAVICLILFATGGLFAIKRTSSFFSTEKPRHTETKADKRNPRLLALMPNVWVKIKESRGLRWHRQAHAGIAYDSKRGTLLIFGSDTHGLNWDNEVHEFDPATETWTTHYQRASRETYRADPDGHAIAGGNGLSPWAMHTFDNIVYDPKLDAIVVTALPGHNPIRKEISNAKIHPTWIYDLAKHEWRIFNNNGKPSPTFFAAASAYDPDRDVIVAYKKTGLWEMGPDRTEWKKANGERHHEIHFMMDYDTKHHKLAVFGDYSNTNIVWVYTSGREAGREGTFERKVPIGDLCPRDQHFPVAFDDNNGVFLLLPDNTRFVKEKSGWNRPLTPQSSSTFVYDLETNRYTKIPGADMPPLKMNYMMVYDKFHKLFLLVTGDHSNPVTVWALRLNFEELGIR